MPETKDYLDESLRRIREALDAKPASVRGALADKDSRLALKILRRAEKRQRRAEHRHRRDQRSHNPATAFIYALAAVVLVAFAASDGRLWWLVFVALGLALKAAEAWSRRGGKAPAPSESAEETTAASTEEIFPNIEARTARVDSVCERLLSEFRQGPKLLREVISRPEETIKALRDSSRELARRETQLRRSMPAGEAERLQKEREQLSIRLGQEKDEVVRQRLSAALSALEGQIAQRRQLDTLASRLEAESTRILYTLENLHAQVLSAKSSAAPADPGLRQSLDQITAEIGAIAEALEAVNRADQLEVQPERQVSLPPIADPGPSSAEGTSDVPQRTRG